MKQSEGESGDFGAIWQAQTEKSQETEVQFSEHKNNQRESRETVIQFGKHKTLEENRETEVQLGQPEDRVHSITRIPEPGPQGRTEHWI